MKSDSRCAAVAVSQRSFAMADDAYPPLLAATSLHESPAWIDEIDRFFSVSKRGSTLATEFRAGTTAFLATANNFVVNAHIMSHAGLDPERQLVSGAFAAGVTCIISGLLSNLPLGMVPSVGPNVYIAYSLVGPHLFEVHEALGISAACGLVLMVLSLTPVLRMILGLMPLSIKYGLLVGTGLLTAFIGLKSIGVIVPDQHGQDIVALGDLHSLPCLISLVSLIFTASMLYNAVTGAVLIGMLSATLVSWYLLDEWPAKFLSLQGLYCFELKFGMLATQQAWAEVASLLLMLLFSVSGAIIGSAKMAGLLAEDGSVRGSTAVFVCSGLGTMLSASLGTAPVFVSMSAAAGIRDGGRTGLVSVVIGIYSLLTAFVLSPLASAVPECAVSPVLVLVGVSMTGEAREIQWWNILDALPAFLCAIFQPFTYSVSNGIYAGCGMSIILFFSTGTFLSFCPSLHMYARATKRDILGEPTGQLHSRQTSLESAGAEEVAAGAIESPVVKAMHRYCGGASFGLDEDAGDLDIRTKLVRLGITSKYEALHLIEEASKFVGLDPAKMLEVVSERLEAGRNVESHYMGGVPGFETARTSQELHHLLPRRHSEQLDPVAVASKQRRNRWFRMGTHA